MTGPLSPMNSMVHKKRPLENKEEDNGEVLTSISFTREHQELSQHQPQLPISNPPSLLPQPMTSLSISNGRDNKQSEKYDDDEDDDEDDIEFLFSLPSDSVTQRTGMQSNFDTNDDMLDNPKLASTSSNECNDMETSKNSNTTSSTVNSRYVTPSVAAKYGAAATTPTITYTSRTKNTVPAPLPTFSHRSSAYIQSLAEICHDILWDARWRVGGSSFQRLFEWEQGEDLSALIYISRRYLERQDLVQEEGKEDLSHAVEDEDDDNDLDRCLETYCRLYFRKGPWFRLDNLFFSYYMPKQKKKTDDDLNGVSNEAQGTSQQSSPTKTVSPSKFFLPVSHRSKRRNSDVEAERDIGRYFDQGLIDQQLEAVLLLLGDIKRLSRMGLIRFFRSEEECGKIVGNNEKYQTSSSCLLRQDEQRSVLAKLGGQKRKRPSPTSSSNSSNGTSQSCNKGNKLPMESSENLIWKQMCQQQAIFQTFARQSDLPSSSQVVLPVTKHVHQVLIEKWAATIVLKASKVEYVPSSFIRRVTAVVCEKLSDWTATLDIGSTVLTATCLRLREAPLETLRRACRLYLCATSGPGDMRGDGTNAWRSLPDKYSNIDLRSLPLRTNNIPPPGSNSWHMVSYPGKDWRMRMRGCNFIRAHIPMLLKDATDFNEPINATVQVFESVISFHSWEIGVELRAMGDFLLELNDLQLYTQRKLARESDARKAETNTQPKKDSSSGDESDLLPGEVETLDVDFLGLQTSHGRQNVIEQLLGSAGGNPMVCEAVERDVCALLANTLTEDGSNNSSFQQERCPLQNEAEKVLGVVAVLLMHVLEYQNNAKKPEKATRYIVKRPWLRHLCWEGCMAYLLWDIIPVLERRGCYDFAVFALEVLLFGKRLNRNANLIPQTLVVGSKGQTGESKLANSYLSRRARGKAYERLIIDYIHIVRRNCVPAKNGKKEIDGKSKSKNSKKTPTPPTASEIVNRLTEPLLLSDATATGRITFSAIRTLARRLKQPLSYSLKNMKLYEVDELGHLLSNLPAAEECLSKYSDWRPVTDTTVANAMTTDSNVAGGRCAYVGFEEDEHTSVYVGSLNVEQLAMEYYHQGRLPVPKSLTGNDQSANGGWIGYHDEGGSVRALFRILSCEPLGMDHVFPQAEMNASEATATIHLTPYQGAPFDLHVGAELLPDRCAGFYQRRSRKIESFLRHLSSLDAAGISDSVYDSIERRLVFARVSKHVDPTLERDVTQVRTLSMLAAGFGGKMLATIFRCFFFDYRHYSGGLPDLTLFRAQYADSGGLVSLGEWVGEKFSNEYQASLRAEQAAQILGDRDEEFLGCSKVGDSGGRSTNRFNRSSAKSSGTGQTNQQSSEDTSKQLSMPDRLKMEHDGRPVRVECMCVEVKSQNDRLDPRQEDWLNILSQHGNARVCKFEKPKKPNTKKNNDAPSKREPPPS
ncbi:VRR-NUC domain containing protein [Nitzschia inconspicua]|uniref:Fanconi-associated nuclease n=1 Tax=Nitzschia inconspicua TaxID=303405 RepID=A0A9K3PIA7_9STRA|nr:VRR-NUC domain containing protein [Nitzschia inconspicua]